MCKSRNAGQLTSQSPDQARFNLVMGWANLGLAGLDAGLEVGTVQRLAKSTMSLAGSGVSLTQRQWSQLIEYAKQGPSGAEQARALLVSVKNLPQQAADEIWSAIDRAVPQPQIAGVPQGALDNAIDPKQPMRMQGTGGRQGATAANVGQLQEKLVARGVSAGRAQQMLQLAKGRPEVMEAVEVLINGQGKGNLRNPGELVKLVEKATEGEGQIGLVRELQAAADRVRLGHDVQLGGGADIVDFTSKEAIQLKNVTSANPKQVLDNLDAAGGQLTGDKGEQVPRDISGKLFQRTAEIIIDNPKNPLYEKTPNQLLKELQKRFGENEILRKNIDSVRVRSGSGVNEFNVKRSKTGDFQFINAPSQSKPQKVSEAEQPDSNIVASGEQSEGSDQVALHQS
jgi:hypothetical protein